MVKDFLAELKLRNVRKTMAIYISSALTTVGVAKLFTDVYELPGVIFSIAVSLLTCGIGNALIVAWFHGAGGTQKIRKPEIALHSLFLLVAAVLIIKVVEQPRASRIGPLRTGKSIAVLPFKNLSDNKEDEYFSDGMTEDILTQLSKISDLKVISRTSTIKYKETQKTIREIGDELDVAAILEGSVRRADNRIRIVGQLIDAQSDEHIWAETYDREYKDIFNIQTEVAQSIAQELRAKLSPQEQSRIQKTPTHNLDAYAYSLRGRELYYHYRKEDNETAIDFFKKAIALDTTYTSAYAGLADAYSQRFQLFGFPETWVDSSITLSKKAIAIDPNVAEPYKALGLAYMQHGWYGEALTSNEKALELNPNYAAAAVNAGLLCTWLGKLDRAVTYIQQSIQLEPNRASHYQALASAYVGLADDSLAEYYFRKSLELQQYSISYRGLAELYMMGGRTDKAKAIIDSALHRFPDDASMLTTAGEVELSARNYPQASTYFEQAMAISPGDDAPGTQLGFLLLQQKKPERATPLLKKKEALYLAKISSGNQEADYRFELMRIYAAQGKITDAIAMFRQAIACGWRVYRWALVDPIVDSLRNGNDFTKIITELKTDVDTMRQRVRGQRGQPQ